ncbi:flagellar basal body rod C-terminal domain-containing protein [Rubrivivax rivuli]|uniref:Flagellar basal body rod protein n=1 Tax=Rubrivivax rivuli TaxID=1862385 RepID=A0A437RF71_9BURK|nr:flagellar basal body rod C-terminal domain-containing protein [Rubrivivax rivuli]RVU45416.1 flagellar basal body rod protein [Rubrivivax rivuli]
MNAVAPIALTGMNAAQHTLRSHAHNLANLGTEGFRRERVQQATLPGGGTGTSVVRLPVAGAAMAEDLVGQMQASHAFAANLAVFKTARQMSQTLLDLQA